MRRLTCAHGLAWATPQNVSPRAGSYDPAIQASPPPRNIIGRSPQVSPPGSPGRATVDVRHSSRPVAASCPVMKQPSSQNRRQPAMPEMTTPSTTSAPLVYW